MSLNSNCRIKKERLQNIPVHFRTTSFEVQKKTLQGDRNEGKKPLTKGEKHERWRVIERRKERERGVEKMF